MKKCYIVGAGDFNNSFTPRDDDFVIAADGGYDSLKKHNIRCDLLIGDLDSLDCVPEKIEIQRHPVEKNETDMHLCYLEGKRRGYTDFVLLGGSGGRSDHTFANYALLSYIKSDGNKAVLSDGAVQTQIIKNEEIVLSSAEGNHLSVFAYGGNAYGVSITGAKYEASNITLKTDFPLGVSNSFLSRPAIISVENGELLIIWTQG